MKSLPPEVPEFERDTRASDEIKRTLAKILGEDGGGFHDPLPLPRTGIF
jgi:hypothetical protein